MISNIIFNRSIELRKIKSLGGKGKFRKITPDDLAGCVTRVSSSSQLEDTEELEEEIGICKTFIPPYEPLVLWTNPDDSDNQIEVR